jgi:hypothetical protein
MEKGAQTPSPGERAISSLQSGKGAVQNSHFADHLPAVKAHPLTIQAPDSDLRWRQVNSVRMIKKILVRDIRADPHRQYATMPVDSLKNLSLRRKNRRGGEIRRKRNHFFVSFDPDQGTGIAYLPRSRRHALSLSVRRQVVVAPV